MRSREKGRILSETLALFNKVAPEDAESSRAQTMTYLKAHADDNADLELDVDVRPARRWQWPAVAAIAAAMTLAVLIPTRVAQSAPAVLEDASGSRKIQFGEVVRPTGDKNATLSMADGSRLEVKSNSELSLERAEDGGTLVRLNRGALTVMAAVTGEVRVQQGANERRLRAGEQAKERLAFEVAAIRRVGSVTPPPGARGSNGSTGPNGCGNGLTQIDGGRIFLGGVSLRNLVSLSHAPWSGPRGFCSGVSNANLLIGGAPWMQSEAWDVEATLPKGTPTYTMTKFMDGQATEVYEMLQDLLVDRFKLVLHRETREMPVYFLEVAEGGPKFNGVRPGAPRRSFSLDDDGNLVENKPGEIKGRVSAQRSVGIQAYQVTMAVWAKSLNGTGGRPVLDRTGLTGEYSFYFNFDKPPDYGTSDGTVPVGNRLGEIGLRLREGKEAVEVWVIDSAERPSEN
jgi:uncharacterized protein (TIGR03435 family)